MASHPAVSAHGPRAGTIESYAHALKTGAEYVEFDIRRTADGELTAFHDPRTGQGEPGRAACLQLGGQLAVAAGVETIPVCAGSDSRNRRSRAKAFPRWLTRSLSSGRVSPNVRPKGG